MKRLIVALLIVCSLFIYACGSGGGKSNDNKEGVFPNVAGQYSVITNDFSYYCIYDGKTSDIYTLDPESDNVTVVQDGNLIDIIPESYDQSGCVRNAGHLNKDGSYNYELWCDQESSDPIAIKYNSDGYFTSSGWRGNYKITEYSEVSDSQSYLICYFTTTFSGSKF